VLALHARPTAALRYAGGFSVVEQPDAYVPYAYWIWKYRCPLMHVKSDVVEIV